MIRQKVLAVKMFIRALGLDVRLWRPQRDPLFFLKQLGINTILDVGANTGQFARSVHAVLPDARIFCFEPLACAYDELCLNMRNMPNFKAFNFALGRRKADAVIYRNEYSPSSSMLPLAKRHLDEFPFAVKTMHETIAVRRLDDVAKELTLTPEVLLKLDVQGAEGEVLAGGREVTRRSRVVLVELSFVELYQGQQLFDEIYETLQALGFSFHGTTWQLLSKSDGRPLQADAMFLRDL